MKKLLGVLSMLFLLVMAENVNAALIERDLIVNGDGLITYDTQSGLEWLDFSVTKNESRSELEGGNFLQQLGFHIATGDEWQTLSDALLVVPKPAVNPSAYELETDWFMFDASAQTVAGWRYFLLNDPWGVEITTSVMMISQEGQYVLDNGLKPYGEYILDQPGGGYVLTRAVPIPSAVWLLGSGLIGLVGFSKKFRKG